MMSHPTQSCSAAECQPGSGGTVTVTGMCRMIMLRLARAGHDSDAMISHRHGGPGSSSLASGNGADREAWYL
jgi:hypothetical protein